MWHKMAQLMVLIIAMAFSTAHGNGCSLQASTDVLYEVECDSALDNLRNLIPQYINLRRHNNYYNQPQNQVNNRKINLNIINLDLDTCWNYNYQYMNENIQKLTINNLRSIPNKITDFKNLQELKNGNNTVLREINLIDFLSITQLQSIEFSYSFIKTLISDPDSRTSHVLYLIDFSNNLIETLPNSCFSNFPKLTTLDLSHNLIQNFDILTFQGIQNLKTLDISFNRIKEIGHNFVRFVNIKTMFLNNNKLTKIIEPNFITMNKLEELNLSFNMLNLVEEKAFQNQRNIEVLDLSYNNLTKITKGTLKNNTKLHKISFANNPIQKIESDVFHGQNITFFNIVGTNLTGSVEKNSFVGIFNDYLNLTNSKLDSLESEAFTGLQTRVLNLSYNIINNISATSFKGIQLIKTLDLSNNNLNCIDFESVDLKQLLIFYVQNNHISKISKSSFDNFVSLKQIDLSNNNILEFESGIFSKLNQLEFLDISNNYLANSLKANSFLGLSSVKNIQLMFNRFTTIENNTFQGLKSLNVLNCSHGELSSIGYTAFDNTGSLEIIDLSYNSLRDFIVNSTSTASLKELRLNDNAINNITEQMPKIVTLNLANNNIVKLKAELFVSSNNLTVLDLSSNNGIEFEEIFKNVLFLSELALNNIRKQFDFKNISKVSITKLDLSFNNIKNISSIFIYKINGISFLDLKSNKISVIDKSSFQSMPALTILDLSFNLISFLQPGSFLQLITLNLHGNSIQALQFGVLDGLHNLEKLNISSNSIREFGETILRTSPAVKILALDDNVIETFKFEGFVHSNIKVITIGGNPLSCHTIADFKKRKDVFTVTAEILDYHTENVDGVKCMTNFVFNKSSSILQNKSDLNATATATFWMLTKAIDGFRASVENFRQSIDKMSLNTYNNKNYKPHEQTTYWSNGNNSDFIALLRNIASIENLMHNLTKISQTTQEIILKNISQTSTKLDQKNIDYKLEEKSIDFNLQEKINVLNAEKEKMIKEMHDHFDNLKQHNLMKSDALVKRPDDYGELKALMYFVAISLTVSVILTLSFIIFKLFKKNNHFQRHGYEYSSSQPITNVIELQDN